MSATTTTKVSPLHQGNDVPTHLDDASRRHAGAQ
jgi:hypothetical protein